MEQNIKVVCPAFRKNPDGSWTTTQVTDISISIGAMRLPSGMVFKKDKTLRGIDVVAVLEQNCK